jgi:hypothetical protein
MGVRFDGGRGETARRFDGALLAGAGDGVSRLSVDDLFIDENGVFCAFRLPLGEDTPLAFSLSRAAAAGFGDAADAYAVNGLRKVLLAFCGVCLASSIALFCLEAMLPPLPWRAHGW